jgi:hypothetical protein
MDRGLRVFQIHYDAASRAALDPDFEPLDNSGSERPDWYEYWPIRQFLRREPLDPAAYYGFLSPRFFAKTGLSGRQVREFARQADRADVITFSPHPCHSACFINVFEQGEFFYPGLLEAAARFLGEVAPGFSLQTCVTHSRNTVFSNFFLARPAFWRSWGELCERLFELAEAPGGPLRALLSRTYDYAKEGGPSARPVQAKVFVVERVATFLLLSARFAVLNYPPFAFPLSERFAGRLAELQELDRLKIAFCDTGDPGDLRAYAALRNGLLRAAYAGGAP